MKVSKTASIRIIHTFLLETINPFHLSQFRYLGLKFPVWKVKYEEMNRLVEKWCEIAYFITIKVSVPFLYILPKCINSLYGYHFTDLGSEAFELPFPTWYF